MSKRSRTRKMASGVMSIDEMLHQNPNVAAESQDDAKCRLFLAQLGINTYFRHTKEPTLSALIYRDHPTHWILGLLWSGYAKPEDNGYQLLCLPKSSATEQHVRELEQSVMAKNGGYDYQAYEIEKPDGWRLRN